MREVVPGSDNVRFRNGSAAILYIKSLDKFIVRPTSAANFHNKFMLTNYDTSFSINKIRPFFLAPYILKLFDTIDEDLPKSYISQTDVSPEIAVSDDILYLSVSPSTTFGRSRLLNIPIGADYESAPKTKQWVTFPPISTPNAIKYKNVYLRSPKFIGNDFLGYAPERLIIFYRTSGISDDSGEWIRIPYNEDLSSIIASSQIQFSVAFDVLGMNGLANRLYGICLLYEDAKQDYHYYPSSEKSNMQENIVAWKQVRSWESSIPNLKISLYDANNNSLILEDTTNIQENGIFEYSLDNGFTWNSWNSSLSSVGYYIRYKANNLPGNVVIKAYISLA
jgi:hypothetical protein